MALSVSQRKLIHSCSSGMCPHLTGIPHSPTGRAVIELAHGTLKCILEKGTMSGETPQSRVAKALYTLNLFLILPNSQNPLILIFFFCHCSPLVMSSCPSLRYGTSLPSSGKVLGTWSLGGTGMLVFLQMQEYNGYLPSVCALL